VDREPPKQFDFDESIVIRSEQLMFELSTVSIRAEFFVPSFKIEYWLRIVDTQVDIVAGLFGWRHLPRPVSVLWGELSEFV